MHHHIHVLISFATFAVFGLAALQAILFYIQNRMIRHKGYQQFVHRLPPLEILETRMIKATWFGFILLTASLLSALVFLDDLYTSTRLHKIILSSLAWLFFAILLFGHHFAGWRGPTAVRWTLSAILLLIVAYFSSKLILMVYWP